MFQVSGIDITIYLRVTVLYAGQGVIAVIGGADVASTCFTWCIPKFLLYYWHVSIIVYKHIISVFDLWL